MKIAVITTAQSDLSRLIEQHAKVTYLTPDEAAGVCDYDAYAVLGGTESEPLVLGIDTRLALERESRLGKRVFGEWCENTVGYAATGAGVRSTVSGRMVWIGEDTDTLHRGDLLDDRANAHLPLAYIEEPIRPMLALAGHVLGHDRIDADELPEYKTDAYALFLTGERTLLCSFRFCNYVRARMAPHDRWDAVASTILSFLLGKQVRVTTEPPVRLQDRVRSPREVFSDGMRWFDGMSLYLDEGKSGVLEGLAHNITPDGQQMIARSVRADCSGEVGGACFFDAYLNGNERSATRFRNLQEFCFDKMIEWEGDHRGMLRWSTTAFGVCYQDDVARAMLGTLLAMQLTDDRRYLDKICAALDYLLLTTGSDGLRKSRTDAVWTPPAKMAQMRAEPANFPCAHHNGYYMAVLLMTYKLTGKQQYLDTAVRGMQTLMAAYPNTIREHSETQELCRLLLPLACLYEVTGDEKHKNYLYTVVDQLEQFRHAAGGYREHDTGYRAARSRTSGTESSLLANNGDPVTDLLYSANWLPLAFAYTYRVTGDERFANLWRELAAFMSEVQMTSDDARLDGCWCRGIDLDRREPYGMPHDVGWGPCAVESGWTVAEILMGLGLGMALGLDKEETP